MGTINGWIDTAKEKLPAFWEECVAYMQAHSKLTLILFACLGCLVCAIIALIVVGCVASAKKRKRKAAEQTAALAAEEANNAETADDAVNEEAKNEETSAEISAETSEEAATETSATEEPVEEKAEETQEEPLEAPAPIAEETPAQETVAEETPVEERKEEAVPVEEKTEESPAPAPAAKTTKPASKKGTKPMAKKETETKTAYSPADKSTKYTGKWVILRMVTDQESEEETYFFELRASNGEKLLSSEEYTSYAGAIKGIATHKTNIEKGNFRITLSKKGDYIFKLLTGKNTLLCTGENYPTKMRCESAIESTKRFAQSAILDENVQELHVKVPAEDDSAITPLPDGYNGKWVIESTPDADGETVYYFALYANNGEKLLTSEEYTTYIGAVNGIATHKKNIESGNFRITLTKRGDYIYKLLNSNGQLLCLGEHYKTRRLCQNAVDSVKRFAANSPMLTDVTNK